MGVVTPTSLYNILWAAVTYANSRDPASEINQYIIANGLLTANIRTDSGQPDAWRDYQQILSELGLIFSTQVQRQITPTPLGLSFLDGAISFSELITYQALRYQYPNGHQIPIGPTNRTLLSRTRFANVPNLVALQQASGVQLRPAVLVWQIFRALEAAGEKASLSLSEIERYLFRCSSHSDTPACAAALITARRGGVLSAPDLGSRERRNAQDWIKFLILTPLFEGSPGSAAYVAMSAFGNENREDLDSMCDLLAQPAGFWFASDPADFARREWYAYFGTLDLAIPLIPPSETIVLAEQYIGGQEGMEESQSDTESLVARQIELRQFQAIESKDGRHGSRSIESVYSADLAESAHRLHDAMVNLIASTCTARGANVFEDPATVDLLVQFRELEFLVEVKSVTPRNFISRLRYAIGQVLHYEYLRQFQSTTPRRCVLAVAAQVPPGTWCIDFVNNHLDFDFLSLQDNLLAVESRNAVANELFG